MHFHDLSIGYGKKVVARGLTAELQSGKVTCLLGSNGVGKSTLLRTLAGYIPPLKGTLDYINPETLGVVLTERIDTMGLRVHEIIALGRHPYTGYFGTLSQEDKDIVHEAMTLTKTEEFANRLFSSLSDGERQKVMIAKALAQETPIILMDEPSAFLDFPSKVALMQMLNYLAHEKQKSILLSTHDIGIALRTADVLWLMQNGELCIGKPEELMLEGKIGNFLGESIKYI